jgi:hypothetical protein
LVGLTPTTEGDYMVEAKQAYPHDTSPAMTCRQLLAAPLVVILPEPISPPLLITYLPDPIRGPCFPLAHITSRAQKEGH